MASIGCPLVGEPLHRSPSCKLLDRHALHAWRLKLPRPGEPPLTFEVRPPPDLTRLMAKLGLPLDGLT
jgi:23S rRNA-/tRNA-specific pseudouridylate synthase